LIMARCLAPFVLLLALAAPASARESLGMFADWGAFRDPAVPRCYAIAKARPSSARRDIRLSRELAEQPRIRLALGDKRFELTGGGGDGWAKNRAMDAAIVAAMRSAGSMSVSATDTRGQRFTDRYSLEGVATALDAATIGCARVAR
jgi:hypothetical protein